jgi:hypothetical protein
MAKGKDKVPTPKLNGAGARDSTATRGWGMAGGRSGHDLVALVGAIGQIHDHCAAQAGKAVNISLTCAIEPSASTSTRMNRRLATAPPTARDCSTSFPRGCAGWASRRPRRGRCASRGCSSRLTRGFGGRCLPNLDHASCLPRFGRHCPPDPSPRERRSGRLAVRELKRQIGGLYCERSGLSKNKLPGVPCGIAQVRTPSALWA